MTTTTGSRLGLAQVCLAGVLWGTGGLVVTVLHDRDGIGAMTASWWRMALAALVLLVFTLATRRDVGAVRRRAGTVVVVGIGTAAYQGLYFVSVLLVGVSVATVVALGLAPVLASIWEHAVARTRPRPGELAVLAAAVCGLVLVSTQAGPGTTATADRSTLGLVLAVAAGATYAATTVLGHHLARHVEPVALTTCATLAGAVVLLPFAAAAAANREPVVVNSAWSWTLLAYLGVATMALAYALLYAGLRTTPGSAATVATLLEPVSAAVLAVVLLGESLTWLAVLGGLLILVAVAALPAEPG